MGIESSLSQEDQDDDVLNISKVEKSKKDNDNNDPSSTKQYTIYNPPPPNIKKHSKKAGLEELFENYAKLGSDDEIEYEDEEKTITGQGILQFASDININPEDVLLLILFWKLNVSEKYKIKKSEFLRFSNFGFNNIPEIKKGVKNFRKIIDNKKEWKELYVYCFNYMRDTKDARNLENDIAIQLWNVILKNKYPNLNKWCEYINDEYKKSINRDTWICFYDFIQSYPDSVASYDTGGAWPSTIDEFVIYLRKKS